MPQRLQQRFYDFGLFRVDAARRLLLWRGDPVQLTPKAFDILLILVQNRDRIVGKEELMKLVWPDTAVEENNLTRNISSLRKVLGEGPTEHRYIVTVPGRGYQFAAESASTMNASAPGLVFERQARARILIEERSEADSAVDPASRAPAQRKFWRTATARLVVAAAGCGLLVSSGWWYVSHWRQALLPPPRVVPLTTLPDRAECGSFSPDGNRVAFSRHSDSPELSGIYIKQIGSDQLLQVTHGISDLCPAWSPDDRYLAFSRYRDQDRSIYLISTLGGAERKLYSGAPSWPVLDWSPDGKIIAFSVAPPGHGSSSISLLNTETLETRKLSEFVMGNEDWGAVFSPDGQRLAFVRTNTAHTKSEIFVMPANGGEARRLTFDDALIPSPPTWLRDGKSLLFSSARGGLPTIWRIPVSGGSPTQVLEAGVKAVHPIISSSGHQLAFEQGMGSSSLWTLEVDALRKKDARRQVTASRGSNRAAEFSPDGTKIVFVSNRSASDEIYTCKADGSNLLQLTSLGAARTPEHPRWSPDGRKVAFDSVLAGHSAIFMIQADGGPLNTLTDQASDNLRPSWSHDGRWIYFTSNRSGQWQIWKMPSQGGDARQLTGEGGFAAYESADSKFIYYAKTASEPDIWKMNFEDKQETALSPRLHVSQWTSWALVDKGIFFVKESPEAHPVLRFLDFANARINDLAPLEKQPWPLWISASADGKSVMYGQSDLFVNIMLVENFR